MTLNIPVCGVLSFIRIRLALHRFTFFLAVYKTPSLRVFFSLSHKHNFWSRHANSSLLFTYFFERWMCRFCVVLRTTSIFGTFFRSRCRCVVEKKLIQYVMHRSGIDLTLFLLVLLARMTWRVKSNMASTP